MRLATVVRREYVERVRSKAFVVSTFLGPLLVVAFLVGPTMLAQRQRGKPLRVAVVDATGSLRPAVEGVLARPQVSGGPRFVVVPAPPAADPDRALHAAREEVLAGRLDGLLYFGPDALRSADADYYGKNVSNMIDLQALQNAADEAMLERRLAGAGIEGGSVKALTRHLELRKIRVSPTGEREDRGQTFLLAMLLLTMLYTTVAMWGAAIMNGVIEEKSNRVVEVIVSSIPTSTLFAGKLIGVGGAGLTQFAVWATTLSVLSGYGVAAGGGGLSLPEVTPLLLASFVIFFLLGYFLYGALYAAVGAAVNTQQEAQSLAFPVMMPLILGFVFFPVVLNNPDGPLSVVLSLVPLFTPMLMFLRITAVTPPLWQIGLSLALTLATVLGTTWFASRVYRVGILMYGKRPTFPEIVRWARRR